MSDELTPEQIEANAKQAFVLLAGQAVRAAKAYPEFEPLQSLKASAIQQATSMNAVEQLLEFAVTATEKQQQQNAPIERNEFSQQVRQQNKQMLEERQVARRQRQNLENQITGLMLTQLQKMIGANPDGSSDSTTTDSSNGETDGASGTGLPVPPT